VFSVDVVFSALSAEKATSTEKATSKAEAACGIRSSAASVRNPAHRPYSGQHHPSGLAVLTVNDSVATGDIVNDQAWFMPMKGHGISTR
jgi:hypothetical protein